MGDWQPHGWALRNPVEIRFGASRRGELRDLLGPGSVLIVTSAGGRQRIGNDPLLEWLRQRPNTAWVDSVSANPSLQDMEFQWRRVASARPDEIVAIGGGSVLDSAKVLRACYAVRRDARIADLLETAPLLGGTDGPPLIALPTTAGTGSEVTPFATVWDPEARRKRSLTGDSVFPTVAIVDPELTHDLPPHVTLTAGLDAVNQAFESVWNRRAGPATLSWAAGAIRLGMAALPALVDDNADRDARHRMAEASVLAGLAISQTRTALCHSISYPLTLEFGVPHGLACAFTMVAVLDYNLPADDGRLADLAHALGFPDGFALAASLAEFCARLDVAGRVREMIPDLPALLAHSDAMWTPGRADNNLRDVEAGAIEAILQRSWAGEPAGAAETSSLAARQ